MKNREIKFRAKRIQSHGDDWEFGHYAYFCQYPDSENKHIMLPNGWQIDENTLGQFTGLHDKNGKEIYEGDIVRFPELYETPEMCSTNYVTAMVIFIHGAFHIQQKDEKITADTYNLAYEMNCYDGNFEVIGNVHQHPDLLK